MSNKNLLNEATIRRFMKLADMEPLANPFMERIDEAHCGDRDDDMAPMEEDMHPAGRDDEPAGRDGYMEEGEHEDKDAMEEDMHAADRDDDMADEPVGAEGALDSARAEEVEDLIGQFVQGLADTLGLDVDVEEDDAEMEVDMDPAPDMDEPAMDEPEMDEPEMDDDAEVMEETTEDALEEEADTALEEVTVIDDEDLISEVAKRVTARLVKAMAKK